jgi:hypothetical protein
MQYTFLNGENSNYPFTSKCAISLNFMKSLEIDTFRLDYLKCNKYTNSIYLLIPKGF